MKKILVAIFALAFLASCAAYAEEVAKEAVTSEPMAQETHTMTKMDETYPMVSVHGQVFTGYTYTRNAKQNMNSFNISRAFFGAHGKVAENWKFGVTLDVAPLFNLVNQNITLSDGTTATAANTNAASVHLVKAYLAYKYSGHEISFGMIKTVWEDWAVKNAWGHDRIAWSPLGVNGYLTNSRWDLGLSAWGKYFDGMLEYHMGFYNGEGYQWISEVSNHKNFQARLTAKPLGDWMSFSTGLQWNGIQNAGDQFVVPFIVTFDLTDMFDHAIYYTFMRSGGQNAQMIAYAMNAYLMDKKINPFFRIDYGLQNKTVANGPALAKKDINIYTGIGYIANKYVSIDLAFIYLRDDSAGDPDTYTFGPFAEVKF